MSAQLGKEMLAECPLDDKPDSEWETYDSEDEDEDEDDDDDDENEDDISEEDSLYFGGQQEEDNLDFSQSMNDKVKKMG